MADLALLIKELIAMDVSIYEIALLSVITVLAWKSPEIIRAIKA